MNQPNLPSNTPSKALSSTAPKSPMRDPLRVAQPSRPATPVPPHVAWNDPTQQTPLMILGGLVLLLIAVYWDMLSLTSAAWSEGLYSHGWIVPLFAVGLLWMRWEPIGSVPSVERWMGLGLVTTGLVIRLVAAKWGMAPVDRISFLPAIFGVFMLVGGMNILRWAWPGLGFLIFMFPWPTKFEVAILLRLQTLASICSTLVLQTLGVPAFRQGNVLNVSGTPLVVADACSGLRMATIFVALAVAMVFLIERPWWDKLIILLSSIPIALIVNIARITITGVMYMWFGQDNLFVHKLAHDWAGLFMMPLALGILWLELQVLERLTIPIEATQLKPVGSGRGAAVPLR